MTTVIDIIKLALKDINELGSSETPDAELSADCLATLNQMIAQWQTQKLYVFAQKVVSFPVDGSQTYSIGTGATINTPLPSRIDSAVWRNNGVDIPIGVMQSLQEYEMINVKTLNGTPQVICYQRSYPLGTVYVWPQPSVGEIRLVVRDAMPIYTSLTNDMAFPDEYALAIRFSLAELMAISFGKSASQVVIKYAADARRVMKRVNTSVLGMWMPFGVPPTDRYDIYADRNV